MNLPKQKCKSEKQKKSKSPSLSKLKKDLWKIFSEYIRRKYAVDGKCTCVSCGVVKPWKEMQAGHYISRRHAATLFDEENVHCQCAKCNLFNQGNMPMYMLYLDKTYGEQKKYDLLCKSQQVHKFYPFQLEEMTRDYKEKVQKLRENMGE